MEKEEEVVGEIGESGENQSVVGGRRPKKVAGIGVWRSLSEVNSSQIGEGSVLILRTRIHTISWGTGAAKAVLGRRACWGSMDGRRPNRSTRWGCKRQFFL